MNYQQCNFCVMDTTAPEIVFDEKGRCNFCKQAEKAYREVMSPQNGIIGLVVKKIKEEGVGKKYDCLIGLSGGADSSTVLHYAVNLGLRPLCFSVDNGWNSQQADLNVLQMVEKLKVPFYRYVIDLKKFKELQSAFIQAGVENIEIPTDHILMAASFEIAAKYGIKHILSGGNVATESIMPESWGYQARDLCHIMAIYKRFTGHKLTGLPLCGIWKFNWYKWVRGIRTTYLLDYIYYNRNDSGKILSETYDWGDVGQKHEESEFTKWHMNFYLFKKFGIDKRKAHYSSQIVSGQMTRDEALTRLEESPEYPELGIERRALRYEKHGHREYPTDEQLWLFLSDVVKFLRKFGLCNS